MLTHSINAIAWRPQIGDPTFAGWLTVFSYFLAAVFAFRAVVNLSKSSSSAAQLRSFWMFTMILSLCLGINKQLDLQSLLTAIGKYYAHQQGWYGRRQIVQKAFILAILLAGVSATVWGINHFKKILPQVWLAFTGILFLMVFILIRASSFHHMDQLIGYRFLGLKMNWILELSGIYCIILNALWLTKSKNKRLE